MPALSFVAVEKRSKLKPEFTGLSQSELRGIKNKGTEITYTVDIPMVAYSGDTEMNPSLVSTEFCESKVVITECTFFEDEHRERAKVGKHLHVQQLKDTWAFAAEDRGDGSFRANTCEVDLSKLLDRLSFIYNNIM